MMKKLLASSLLAAFLLTSGVAIARPAGQEAAKADKDKDKDKDKKKPAKKPAKKAAKKGSDDKSDAGKK
jgi:hypothetical protein